MSERPLRTTRADRLNALAKRIGAERYLEIGVARGFTFTAVDVPYKVAVDPAFRFDTSAHASPTTFFHQVPSDTFFSELAERHGRFDLIYVDGLHTFEQTLRDFTASLAFAHDGTVWLIDDTVPTGRLASLASQAKTRRYRKLLRIKDGRWMGDVFKVVFAIHDFFPQYSYATYSGHGQTVVWRETRRPFAAKWDSFDAIGALTYRDFVQLKDPHMAVQDEEAILQALTNAGVPDRRPDGDA